ncbi:EpsG family protein [Escherichia coli]
MIYDSTKNPDINNYMNDYLLHLNYYEPGYRLLVYINRELLNLNFEYHWYALLFIQAILIYIIYNRLTLIILAYIVFVPITESYLGTQVRYSISILLFLVAILRIICNDKKWNETTWILMLSAALMHIGSLVLLLIYYIAANSKASNIFRGKVKWRELFFYAAFIPLLFYGKQIIIYLMQFTRFVYFEDGSVFLEPRSTISIIYMLVSAIFIRAALALDSTVHKQNSILVFSYLLLISSLITASVSVLSARIFTAYVMLQPLIIYSLIFNRRAYLYGLLLLTIATVQLCTYLVLL